MTELEGKLAYKKRGFFSGIIGTIQLNKEPNAISNYLLEYRDGSKNGFNSLSEIKIVEDEGGHKKT